MFRPPPLSKTERRQEKRLRPIVPDAEQLLSQRRLKKPLTKIGPNEATHSLQPTTPPVLEPATREI